MGNEMAKWVELVEHDKWRSCIGTPTSLYNGPDRTNTKSVAANKHGPNYTKLPNTAWSGYGQNENSPAYWEWAQSSWLVPQVNGTQCCTAQYEYSSNWGGIGDNTNGTTLIQQGSNEDAYSYIPSVVNISYGAWVENTGNVPGSSGYNSAYGKVQVAVYFSNSVQPGDAFYGEDWTSGPEMYVEDETLGATAIYVYGPQPDGHSFSCIVENVNANVPGFTSTNAYLGQTYFTNCEGQDSNGYHHPMGVNEFAWYWYIVGTTSNWMYWPTSDPCTSISVCNTYGGFDIDTQQPG
jgi:hypothetical protein